MKPVVRLLAAFLVAIFIAACQTSAPSANDQRPVASQQPTAGQAPAVSPDCPASLTCTIDPPAYVDAVKNPDGTFSGEGTNNYTFINGKREQRPIFGLVIHTTEGTDGSAANSSHDPTFGVSWNYLIKADGSVNQSVPLNGVAYDSANRWFNTHYLQIDLVGYAGEGDISPEQHRALAELGRYLAQRFQFQVNSSTVIGHDTVPGINDEVQRIQHWDPGPYFDWRQLLIDMGAPAIEPGDASKANVVTIAIPFNKDHLNFAPIYTTPREQCTLLCDPYVHPEGQPVLPAPDDWGAKAQHGHSYVVADRDEGWTGIWFNGQLGWVQNKWLAPLGFSTAVVTPKQGKATIYSRPMPSNLEFDASAIPDDIWQKQAKPADLTKYDFSGNQAYPVAPVQAINAFYEGCDTVDCSAPGDGTIVKGKDEYLMIEFGHRLAFVKKDQVTVSYR